MPIIQDQSPLPTYCKIPNLPVLSYQYTQNPPPCTHCLSYTNTSQNKNLKLMLFFSENGPHTLIHLVFSAFLLPIITFCFHFIALQSHKFLPHHHFHLLVSRTMERKRPFTEKSKDKVIEEAEDEEEEEDERKGGIGGGHAAEEEKKKGVGGSIIRGSSGGYKVSSASCQAERCGANLADAKRYHRRHKVCEFHSKAPVVIVAGRRQRFCQQCSRFHDIGEFDEAKRSCRRRLAEHNERRRKSNAETHNDGGEDHRHQNSMEGRFRHVDERGRRMNQMDVNCGNWSSKSFHIR